MFYEILRSISYFSKGCMRKKQFSFSKNYNSKTGFQIVFLQKVGSQPQNLPSCLDGQMLVKTEERVFRTFHQSYFPSLLLKTQENSALIKKIGSYPEIPEYLSETPSGFLSGTSLEILFKREFKERRNSGWHSIQDFSLVCIPFCISLGFLPAFFHDANIYFSGFLLENLSR